VLIGAAGSARLDRGQANWVDAALAGQGSSERFACAEHADLLGRAGAGTGLFSNIAS
jgi:hypothetical protein